MTKKAFHFLVTPSIVQPFRNRKIDFTPPRITGTPPMFGADKWVERQNESIEKAFTSIVRKIEALYMRDAERMVKAAQGAVLADFGELLRLRKENESLLEANGEMESELNDLLEHLASPLTREMILAAVDLLSGGQPIVSSSRGGGSTSDLAWDGRRPDEDDEAYRRRCFKAAVEIAKIHRKSSRRR